MAEDSNAGAGQFIANFGRKWYRPTWQGAAPILALGLIGIMSFLVRLFAIIRFESVIHEYDPYFNFRTTKRLSEEGFEEFWNWFDENSWYPLGRVIGQTLFPGIMTTAFLMHKFVNVIGLPIDIRDICVFTAPIFSAFCAWVTYLFTIEVSGKMVSAGLLAALFIGLSPSYMSRSVGGGFDNEAIAIFTLVASFYTFIRAMRKGTILSVVLAVFAYFYMVAAWGGYVFVTNVVALYVILLMFLGKFTDKHYAVYSSFYVLGSLMCLNIPFVGFAAVTSSEHMIAHGVFLLGNVYHFRRGLLRYASAERLRRISQYAVVGGFVCFTALFLALLALGKTRWSGRSMTLLDPTYASKYIPIIASVSEHQPPTWSSYIFDLHLAYLLSPLGLWLVWRSTNELSWFVGLYGVLAVYFSGVMVRLMLVLSPATSVLGAIGASSLLGICAEGTKAVLLKAFLPNQASGGGGPSMPTSPSPLVNPTGKHTEGGELAPKKKTQKFVSLPSLVSFAVSAFLFHLLFNYVKHGVWIASNIYAHPSIILSGTLRDGSRLVQDDFREAYAWFNQNTHPNSRLMSWWDYGYQSCYMGNRSVLVDNNTWNNTHIATVGMAFASPEEVAFPVVSALDVDYVFVVFGGISRYSGDDINKFLWMVRIGGGVFPFAPRESEYFTPSGRFSTGDDVSKVFKDSLMYRLSYHRFAENGLTKGYDLSRKSQIPKLPPLKYFEEVYTTSSWIVRIYRVKRDSDRRAFGQQALRNVLTDPPPAV